MCIPSESEIARAMEIAKSPAGQQLIDLLQGNNTIALQEAMEQAGNGDFSQMQQMLSQFMKTPEADALMKKIRGSK